MSRLKMADWRPRARDLNNEVIDRMVAAIHSAVDMRANDVAEETLALALAEKVDLIQILLRDTFNGMSF